MPKCVRRTIFMVQFTKVLARNGQAILCCSYSREYKERPAQTNTDNL